MFSRALFVNSVYVICFIAILASGCGSSDKGSSGSSSSASAPLRFEGESSASVSTSLSDFDITQINRLEVVARSGQGPLEFQVIEGSNFSIVIEAEGHTAEEVAHYFQGSIRENDDHVLRITLGDRYVGCSRSTSQGTLINVNGICAKRIIVSIPRSSSVEFYIGMQITNILRQTRRPDLRRVSIGDNFTIAP